MSPSPGREPGSGTGDAALLDPGFLRQLEALTLQARGRHAARDVGNRRTARRGAGLEFESHRGYVAGDDLRHLDWPLLARLDRPFVKTYEQERELPVHLLLDTSRSMSFGEPSKLLACARLAAALGHVALSSLDRVGAALYDGRGLDLQAPARGRSALWPLLQFLSGARPEGSSGPADALKLHAATARPGLTVIFSDFLDRDFESFLRPHLARRHSLVLVQMLAREEVAPEVEGDLELIDVEAGGKVEVTVGRRELEAYHRRLEEHRGALRRFGLRYGAEVFSLVSDQPLEEALWDHLFRGSFLRA